MGMRDVRDISRRVVVLGTNQEPRDSDLGPTRRRLKVIAMEPVVLTPERAATYLAVGPTTLYHLTRRGEVRSLKIGRSRRYRKQDLDEYLESLLKETA
jgi:excisionase family DNA binding protein